MDGSVRPDPDDPEVEDDLRDLIGRVDDVHCPCGWSGNGDEMEVDRLPYSRELSCPRCGRVLRIVEANFEDRLPPYHPDADIYDDLDL